MNVVAPIVDRTPIACANENAAGVGAADASACKRLQAVVLGQVHRAELNLRAMLCMQMLVRLALGQGRLHVALPWQQDLGRLLNWGAKDVSLALHGGEDQGRKVRGLVEMGLVDLAVGHLPPSGALGGNKPAPGCLVTVRVDWRRWDVKWRYAEGDWAAAASRVNAYWTQLGRQCEMSEIRERFQLNELMLAEEVQRALSYTNVESSVVALNDVPVAPNGAARATERVSGLDVAKALREASNGVLTHRTRIKENGGVRRSCEVGGGEGVQLAVVAPNGGDSGGDGLGGKMIYRNGKCELPAKAGDLPKRETGRARARPIGELEREIGKLTNSPNWSMPIGEMDSVMIEELKTKLNGDEREWCWAAGVIIGGEAWRLGRMGRKYGDGLVWRLRWQHQPSRALCRTVYMDAVENRATMRQPAGYVADLWTRLGGDALDRGRFATGVRKKLKESF